MQVVARYLWGNIEPALARRVRQEVRRPALDVFRESPYIGLHIRRGDKIAEGEMEFIETKVGVWMRVVIVYGRVTGYYHTAVMIDRLDGMHYDEDVMYSVPWVTSWVMVWKDVGVHIRLGAICYDAVLFVRMVL